MYTDQVNTIPTVYILSNPFYYTWMLSSVVISCLHSKQGPEGMLLSSMVHCMKNWKTVTLKVFDLTKLINVIKIWLMHFLLRQKICCQDKYFSLCQQCCLVKSCDAYCNHVLYIITFQNCIRPTHVRMFDCIGQWPLVSKKSPSSSGAKSKSWECSMCSPHMDI